MEIRLRDVKTKCFEEKIRAFLLRDLMQSASKSRYIRLTWGAQREIDAKVEGFSESTKQLIMRSHCSRLIQIVIRKAADKDLVYMATEGTEDVLDHLRCLDIEKFKPLIPLLLKRNINLSHVGGDIVRGIGDLRVLYNTCKETHPELLERIRDDDDCPADLFVEILNNAFKNKDIESVNYSTTSNLVRLIKADKVKVVQRTPECTVCGATATTKDDNGGHVCDEHAAKLSNPEGV